MKNLLKDTKALYSESWGVAKRHWKGGIFIMVLSIVISFGPIIVRYVADKIKERKS